MKRKSLFYVLLLSLFFLPIFGKSQNNEDFAIWTGYKLKKSIAPGTSIRFRQEIRLINNASQIQKVFNEIGIRHKFNKYFSIGISYRNSQNVQRENAFSSRHRMDTYLSLSKKWKTISLQYKARYQLNYRDIFTSENGFTPRQFLRHRFLVELDLNRRWNPYVSTEIFNVVRDLPNFASVQNRYRLGVEYDLNKNNSISVFYMIRTRSIKTPETDYILGLRLHVKI
ncbi:MAG: DUF2490 domain-containing protein [Bacteroidota bacterium]|nr:DUF2490 domain-containing protein [Bacteroidota bacterium]